MPPLYVPLPGGNTASAPTAADQAARYWALDPQNSSGIASDSNRGYGTSESDAATAPLLTWNSLMSRLNNANYPVNVIVEIFLMSDITTPVAIPGSISTMGNDQLNGFGGFLCIVGKQTVIRSGTLTAGTAAQSGNNPQIIVDSTLATTWSAVNGVSDSTHSVWIRKTGPGATAHAEVQFDSNATLAKSAHTSQPVNISETPGQQFGTSDDSFSSGDAYQLYTIPKIAGITVGGALTLRLYCVDIASTGNTSQIGPSGSTVYTTLCSFVNGVVVNTVLRCYATTSYNTTYAQVALSLNNGCSTRGNASEGLPGVSDFWVFVQITTSGKWTLSHGNLTFNGGNSFTQNLNQWDMYLWDNQANCLKIQSPGTYFFDIMHGSNPGTHDQPIAINSSGVSIVSQQATFAAAYPITLYGGSLCTIIFLGAWGLNTTFTDFPYHNDAAGVHIDLFNPARQDLYSVTSMITAGANLAANSCVTANSIVADNTDGTKPAIGVAPRSIGSASIGTLVTKGICQGAAASLAGAAGAQVWLSTAGGMTLTKPSTAGKGLTRVGYVAANTNDLWVDCQNFGVVGTVP